MAHVETALVTHLMGLGIKHRRAVAFERWLDDTRPCGFCGDAVADLFERHHKRQVALRKLEEAEAEQMMLTYGTTDVDSIRKIG